MIFVSKGNEYLSKLNKIRFLVIDEADRMIEKQHYNELERILELVNRYFNYEKSSNSHL